MDSSIWVAILSTLGTFITVGGTVIVALISKNTNKKIDRIEDVKSEILEQVKKNREEYKKEISDHIMDNEKTYLTDFLSDIENGETKLAIQMYRAYETKRDYNKRDGDSYIDDKWEELVRKGILKERRPIYGK